MQPHVMDTDPASPVSDAWLRIRVWRHRPRAVDAAIAVAATVPPMIAIALGDPSWRALTLVTLVMAGAALLWRRRAPWCALVAVALLAAIAEPRPFTLIVAVAVFEVARQRRMAHAFVGYLIGTGLPLAGTVAKIALGLEDRSMVGAPLPVGLGTSIVEAYVVIGLAAGIVLQNVQQRRRAQVELLQQHLEHERALERARIAAEMHDIVGHALTVMIALANGARAGSRTDPARSSEALEHLTRVGASALDDMHRTLRLMRERDAELDDALDRSGHDLPSLEDSIEVFRAAGLPVTYRRTGSPIPDDLLLTTTIHRIVQEGLTNALRYAKGASFVDVAIGHEHGLIVIDITDDGHSDQARSVGSGRGLIGIAERAAAFDGTSSAGPRSPRGWETRAILRTEHRA